MNIISPVRLIPPRFLYVNVAVLGIIVVICVTLSKSGPTSEDVAKALFFLLMVPMVFAGLLSTIMSNALRWVPTALLPGIHRKLVGWAAATIAVVSIIWGASIALLFPLIPLLVAISTSAAFMALALPVSRPGWDNPQVLAMVAAYTIGHIWPLDSWSGVAQAIIAHPWITALCAGTICFITLWVALDRRRLKRLQITVLPAGRTATFKEWLQRRSWRSVAPDKSFPTYASRRSSVIGWVRAIHQERGGSGFTTDISIVALFLVLIYPAMTESGGYPEAWYRLVFDRSSGGNPIVLFMIWCMIVFLGLIAPAPRKEHLYPISRQRRATLAFVSLLVVWSSLVLVLIGTPVLFAILTGLQLGLEMPRDALVNFLAPAGITLPALALVRWSKLQLDGKIEFAMAFVLIAAFIGIVIGCTIASLAKPATAITLSTSAMAIALPLFYAGIRIFYHTDDLVSSGDSTSQTGPRPW